METFLGLQFTPLSLAAPAAGPVGGVSPVSSGGAWPLLMGWCCPASAPGVGDGAEGAAGRASWVPSCLSDNRLCGQAAHDFHMDPRLRRFQKQDISLFLVGSLYCWL